MKTRNQWLGIWFVISMLVIVSLACGTGYTFSHRSDFTNSGQVVVRNGSVEGDDTVGVEIDEDLTWDEVVLDITATVETGNLQAVFTDDTGHSLSLSAAASQPASGHIEMETDGSGKINLELSGEGVTGMVITINYTPK